MRYYHKVKAHQKNNYSGKEYQGKKSIYEIEEWIKRSKCNSVLFKDKKIIMNNGTFTVTVKATKIITDVIRRSVDGTVL